MNTANITKMSPRSFLARNAGEVVTLASPGVTFSRTFTCWTLDGHEHLNVVSIESNGRDLDDLLSNAELSLETWHGNEGPQWTVGDLSRRDFDLVVEMFNEFLQESAS